MMSIVDKYNNALSYCVNNKKKYYTEKKNYEYYTMKELLSELIKMQNSGAYGAKVDKVLDQIVLGTTEIQSLITRIAQITENQYDEMHTKKICAEFIDIKGKDKFDMYTFEKKHLVDNGNKLKNGNIEISISEIKDVFVDSFKTEYDRVHIDISIEKLEQEFNDQMTEFQTKNNHTISVIVIGDITYNDVYPIGVAMYNAINTYIYISQVAISPLWQSLGIGEKLLKNIDASGHKNIVGLVRKKNVRALKFYTSKMHAKDWTDWKNIEYLSKRYDSEAYKGLKLNIDTIYQ